MRKAHSRLFGAPVKITTFLKKPACIIARQLDALLVPATSQNAVDTDLFKSRVHVHEIDPLPVNGVFLNLIDGKVWNSQLVNSAPQPVKVEMSVNERC